MPKAVGEWKLCAGCGKTKHVSEFGTQLDKADGLTYSCKDCKNGRSRKWKKKNRKSVYEYNKVYKEEHKEQLKKAWHKWAKKTGYYKKEKVNRSKIKERFIRMYGTVCSCCGESRKEFLTLEHIHGQIGVKIKESGSKAYTKAVAKYDPEVYDLLCMNCNFSRGKYGYCPHDNERQ